MHALYLQQAVCLLPNTEAHALALEALGQRVREFEGEATLLHALSPNAAWEKEIDARFESERLAMFEKLREEIQKFVDEIRFEEHRKRFTLEELEELEVKLEALERWFAKLKQKEPGSSRVVSQVKDDLQEASRKLEGFAGQVEEFEKKERRSRPKLAKSSPGKRESLK